MFLSRIYDGNAPGFESFPDDQLVNLAQAVCADWDNGTAWEAIYANFEESDPVESVYFMAAAGEAYCPSLYRYMNRRMFGQ